MFRKGSILVRERIADDDGGSKPEEVANNSTTSPTRTIAMNSEDSRDPHIEPIKASTSTSSGNYETGPDRTQAEEIPVLGSSSAGSVRTGTITYPLSLKRAISDVVDVNDASSSNLPVPPGAVAFDAVNTVPSLIQRSTVLTVDSREGERREGEADDTSTGAGR